MENCPQCGKKVKFLKKHIKRMHSEGKIPGKIPEKVQKISRENSSFLKEINLMEVYKKMTETINPKKDEKKEPAYQCGACKGTFEEKYKRCPHCGVEF